MFERPFLQSAYPNLQRAFFEHAFGNLMKILGLQMILKSAGMKGNLLNLQREIKLQLYAAQTGKVCQRKRR